MTYPVARTSKRPAPAVGAGPEPTYVRPTVVAIDVRATKGGRSISIGDRVRIVGSGLYAGEIAIVETVAGGVIPAAVVRTEAGRTRRVRTIDLEPVTEADRAAAEGDRAASEGDRAAAEAE